MRVIASAAILFFSLSAFAWSDHQEMVNRMLIEGAPSGFDFLQLKVPLPCREDEQKEIEALAVRVEIRAGSVPLFSKRKCAPGKSDPVVADSVPLVDLLKSGFIDEPDLGMDQDLPDRADPNGYRKWMGGSTGPTSQGFRHMVFPGIEWAHPLRTVQIPVSSVGSAPERIELLGETARNYIREGNLFFGLRVLLWREHLIEDLLQPFHSSQVPDLSMLPWNDLFSDFVKRSTHAISNYHYAYEGLAREMVKVPDERGVQECFGSGTSKPYGGIGSHLVLPRSKASDVGSALILIFGDYLKSSSVDLPRGTGEIDYYELLNARAEVLEADEKKSLSSSEKTEFKRNGQILSGLSALRNHTCALMKEATALFWGSLDQALRDVSTSSKTGK